MFVETKIEPIEYFQEFIHYNNSLFMQFPIGIIEVLSKTFGYIAGNVIFLTEETNIKTVKY